MLFLFLFCLLIVFKDITPRASENEKAFVTDVLTAFAQWHLSIVCRVLSAILGPGETK